MNTKQRYQLSTPADGLGELSSLVDALKMGIREAGRRLEQVRIFDRYAHSGNVALWEIEPGDDYAVPVKMKRK